MTFRVQRVAGKLKPVFTMKTPTLKDEKEPIRRLRESVPTLGSRWQSLCCFLLLSMHQTSSACVQSADTLEWQHGKTQGQWPLLNENDTHLTPPSAKRRMKKSIHAECSHAIIKKEESHRVAQPYGRGFTRFQLQIHVYIKPPLKLENCTGCSAAEALRLSTSSRDRSVTQGWRQVGHHGPLRTSSEHRLPPQFTRGRAHS